jgi:hypothetical protein
VVRFAIWEGPVRQFGKRRKPAMVVGGG